MLDINVETWLETWVTEHLRGSCRSDVKATMQSQAKACAEGAVAAGLRIAALKVAAGGDLEIYLLERQNTKMAEQQSWL